MNSKTKKCDYCDTTLAFVKNTRTGKWIPVAASLVDAGETEFDPDKHRRHHLDCPGASRASRDARDKREPRLL